METLLGTVAIICVIIFLICVPIQGGRTLANWGIIKKGEEKKWVIIIFFCFIIAFVIAGIYARFH